MGGVPPLREVVERGAEGQRHLESDFLARGESEAEVRKRVGDLPLARVREILEMLIREHAPRTERPWWEVMRDENDDDGDAPRAEETE